MDAVVDIAMVVDEGADVWVSDTGQDPPFAGGEGTEFFDGHGNVVVFADVFVDAA
jgi:hypothetical protein